MIKNTAGAVLMLVLAAAGLWWAKPVAVLMVILTCVLTFLCEEIRDISRHAGRSYAPASHAFAAQSLAFGSWATSVVAIISLVI